MFAWHGTPWMWVSMVVFWAVFGIFAYYAIRGTTGRPAQSQRPPIEILKERYARGEITAEEYREGCETLRTPGDRS